MGSAEQGANPRPQLRLVGRRALDVGERSVKTASAVTIARAYRRMFFSLGLGWLADRRVGAAAANSTYDREVVVAVPVECAANVDDRHFAGFLVHVLTMNSEEIEPGPGVPRKPRC